jgi:membrane protease YdiL (CAAX protease family)
LYFVILGTGMAYLHATSDNANGNAGVIMSLVWVQGVLCALCIYFIVTGCGWAGSGFGRLRWSALIWLSPAIIVLITMWAGLLPDLLSQPLSPIQSQTLMWLALTTAMIGFSEEAMFRGILLRGAMTVLSVPQAMILSATAFALLHMVSGLGGEPLHNGLQQLGFAFLVGLALAPVALRLGSLWPLVIWHGLWDMAVFASDAWGVLHHFALPGMFIQVLVGLWLWRAPFQDR